MHPKSILSGIFLLIAVIVNAQDSIRPVEQDTALVPVVEQPRFIAKIEFNKTRIAG
ncbi:MAG: hypothetical protein IPH88_04925 [Bacteroidales bacterium]|nr:hypothetical protein [Bacteroidales bacterium]